ncbi:MAG: hypothetical protein ACKO2Z_11590 [Sphaerospermopsis kisseleviana]
MLEASAFGRTIINFYHNFLVRAKHSDEQLSIFITIFLARAKHSDEQLSIFITGYFPNASPLRLLNFYVINIFLNLTATLDTEDHLMRDYATLWLGKQPCSSLFKFF